MSQKITLEAAWEKMRDIGPKLDNMRTREFADVSLSDFLQEGEGQTLEAFLSDLGIDPNIDTIANLQVKGDFEGGYRWLIPELIRPAMRLGLRNAPIYNNFISAEETITQTSIKMPHWNMSDATPEYVNEAETIPIGTVSYGERDVAIRKMGKGFVMSYEVLQYVSVNVANIFFEDFGIKLGQGLDVMAIDTLVNGDAADGSLSAPVIGVEDTAENIQYIDMVRAYIRMSRIGRVPTAQLAGEATSLDYLLLPEVKGRAAFQADMSVNANGIVLPTAQNHYIHGNVNSNQMILVNRNFAMMKLNAQPLLIERDRIVSNQTMEIYATLTTGFANILRDGRLIIDKSIPYSSNGFPSYLDVDAAENVVIA